MTNLHCTACLWVLGGFLFVHLFVFFVCVFLFCFVFLYDLTAIACHCICTEYSFLKIISWDISILPNVVMPLNVNLVENPFRRLQEIFLHFHCNIPGQKTHQETFLKENINNISFVEQCVTISLHLLQPVWVSY